MSVFFFSTSTGLATHCDFLISLMNPAASSRSTAASTAARFGPDTRLVPCLTGFELGNNWRECSANFLGIPGMSAGHHANMSQFSRRNSTSALSYAGSKLVDTLTVLEGSVGCTWCARVSLEVLKDLSAACFLCSGRSVRSLDIASSAIVASMPKVSEILLNSRSHKSDF